MSGLLQNNERNITKIWVDYHKIMRGISQKYEQIITKSWVEIVESWYYKIMSGLIIPGYHKIMSVILQTMSGFNWFITKLQVVYHKTMSELLQNYERIIIKLWAECHKIMTAVYRECHKVRIFIDKKCHKIMTSFRIFYI